MKFIAHLPAFNVNEHRIRAAFVAAVKPAACVVNVAVVERRGVVTDENAAAPFITELLILFPRQRKTFAVNI